MKHDPLCKFSKKNAVDDEHDDCEYCELIAKVRVDEATKLQSREQELYDSWTADTELQKWN